MSWETPGSKYSELVESDKRSVIEKVIQNVNLLDYCPGVIMSQPINLKNSSDTNDNRPGTIKSIYDQFATILNDDNEDDMDEVWENILIKAKEAFEEEQRFQLLQKKHPYLVRSCIQDVKPRKQGRKRKSNLEAVTRRTIDQFMSNFKDTKSSTICTNSSEDSRKIIKNTKKSINFTKSSRFLKCSPLKDKCIPNTGFPKWKKTFTNTPIFPLSYNPNWVDINQPKSEEKLNFQNLMRDEYVKKTPSKSKKTKLQGEKIKDKFYTPGHVMNWVDDAGDTAEMTVPSTCKSYRSDAATCHTELDNMSLDSAPTTLVDSSSPSRKTTVRFRSSPECFSYSDSGKSSISNLSLEQINNDHLKEDFKQNEFSLNVTQSNQDFNESPLNEVQNELYFKNNTNLIFTSPILHKKFERHFTSSSKSRSNKTNSGGISSLEIHHNQNTSFYDSAFDPVLESNLVQSSSNSIYQKYQSSTMLNNSSSRQVDMSEMSSQKIHLSKNDFCIGDFVKGLKLNLSILSK